MEKDEREENETTNQKNELTDKRLTSADKHAWLVKFENVAHVGQCGSL